MAGTAQPSPDARLVTALARAHRWAKEMRGGTPLSAVAAREGASDPFVGSRVRLAFLAPALQLAILKGTRLPHLTLERIIRAGVPLDWSEQMRLHEVEGRALGC